MRIVLTVALVVSGLANIHQYGLSLGQTQDNYKLRQMLDQSEKDLHLAKTVVSELYKQRSDTATTIDCPR